MLRTATLLAIGFVATASISSAFAADNGFYIGGAISQASVDVDLSNGVNGVHIDDENTKFKIIAGVRPLDWFAVELNYVDFGSVDATAGTASGEYKLKGFSGFALGLFEVAVVDFYGKLGFVRWDQNASFTNVNLPSFDDSGFDLAYGVGIQAHFGSLGARLEYEKFDIDNVDASLISLGVTWTFL